MSDMAALEMSLLLTYSLKTANESMQLVSNISYDEYLHYYTEYREKYNRHPVITTGHGPIGLCL